MTGRNLSRLVCAAAAALVALLGGLAMAESSDTPPTKASPLRVVVSIPPLRGLISPLLDEAGIPNTIDVLIPVGASEHGYEIPPAMLGRLAGADLVVEVGLGLEPQVDKLLASQPDTRRRVIVLADAAGIFPDKGKDEAGRERGHDHEEHNGHEDDDDHHHGTDPHIWLDPVLVEKVIVAEAKVLRDMLGADAAASARVAASEAAVLARVRALDERYRTTIGSAARRTIVVGHDAWGYLARRYGIETIAIKGLTASEPTPAAMQAAVVAVRDKKASCVFAEPQLGRAAADHIAAATGVPVRTLDPLGDGDWFKLMEANLKELASAMDARLAPAGSSTPASTNAGKPGPR